MSRGPRRSWCAMADTLAIQQTAHVIDRAGKLAFHSKRQHLTPMDVVAASGEQGYGGAALPQLLHVPDADLLYRFEADLSASETVRAQQLPAAPLEVGVAQHWLAVDGVQPATAENAQPRRAAAASAGRGPHGPVSRGGTILAAMPSTGGGAVAGGTAQALESPGGIAAGLPLKHSLPDELQLYYSMVRRALQHKAGGAGEGPLTVRAVTASLATDPGLQPVLPYLVPLLADEVGRNLKDVQQLRVVLSAMRALLTNVHLQIVPYIHHLLPAIITCLVARGIGGGDDHWAIRDEAASLLGQISQQSQQRHDELAPALARVQNTLAAALFDTPPETQYGSLVGLMAFGVPVLLHLVMPKLQRYADMFQESQGWSPAKLHVRSALVAALGRCMAWQNGSQAAQVLKAVADAGLAATVQAVAPSTQVFL